MSRLPESVAALALSLALCFTTAAGPAAAEPTATPTTPAVPTSTDPTSTDPTPGAPTSTAPTTGTSEPGGIAPRVVGYLGWPGAKPLNGWPLSKPVPGVEVVLTDQVTGAVVARAVTEAGGSFTFLDLPAGTYGFAVRGPWRLTSDPYLVALAGEDGPVPMRHWYYVEPGPEQPGPGQPGAGGGAAPREELAATGADVAWLALAGLLALLAGTVLVRRVRA